MLEEDVSASLLYEMYRVGFITDYDDKETLRAVKAIEALYPEIYATLVRQKRGMTWDEVFDIARDIAWHLPFSPESRAMVIFAVEWQAREIGCLRESSRDPYWGSSLNPYSQLMLKNRSFAVPWYDYAEESPWVPELTSFFPSFGEIKDAFRLDVPFPATYNVYQTVFDLYRTFGVFPDFPTLIERLQQRPMTLSNGYTWIWYVWRVMADLYQVIHDRMQEVLDAAGK